MATRRALLLLEQLRTLVGDDTDQVVRELSAAWVQAWDRLRPVWRETVAELADLVAEHGGIPPAYLLARLERLTAATGQTQAALAALSAAAAAQTSAAAVDVIAASATAEPAIIAAQMPARTAAAVVARYAQRVEPSVLEQIAMRCRQQIHASHWPLAADAVEAMRRALTVGVATGAGPAETARQMLAGTEREFNGGLHRAVVIARTEMLDAYRETARHVDQANADVLAGWVWIASLGPRCCPSCWGMHGTVHPVDEAGPHDHQQGRCARMPQVRPWADLGFDLPEPADLVPDAAAVFAALPHEQQLAVMGRSRLALLDSGRISLADLATRRDSTTWRPSWSPTSVAGLHLIAARRTP